MSGLLQGVMNAQSGTLRVKNNAEEGQTDPQHGDVISGPILRKNMLLARVVGTVVSSHKSAKLAGVKFLLLETLDPTTMKGKNSYVVAMDAVGAGEGEIVFFVAGSSARLTTVTEGKPADATIIAIVDAIEKDGSFVYQKSSD
jgi:ethanolamine utilization protein EutN/carbon dioxide concentrating mechanism protein CcmL